MPFDPKIGVFILWDILVALLFSVFAFSTMLATAGPEGTWGELSQVPGVRIFYRNRHHGAGARGKESEATGGNRGRSGAPPKDRSVSDSSSEGGGDEAAAKKAIRSVAIVPTKEFDGASETV